MEVDSDPNEDIVCKRKDDLVSEKTESYLKQNYLDISSDAVASSRFGHQLPLLRS